MTAEYYTADQNSHDRNRRISRKLSSGEERGESASKDIPSDQEVHKKSRTCKQEYDHYLLAAMKGGDQPST